MVPLPREVKAVEVDGGLPSERKATLKELLLAPGARFESAGLLPKRGLRVRKRPLVVFS